jgi:hypothetical protein
MGATAGKVVPIVEAKTANYTLDNGDWGKIFTNRGAGGAVTFTLPAVAGAPSGAYAHFFVVADQTVTIAGTAGEVVTFNDPTANSVAFSTSSEKVGAGVYALCDGTSWLLFLNTEETQTTTVAT